MNRFKAFLIGLLGGERKVYIDRTRTVYKSHGRPFELSDWERLASMDSWGQEFFRFLEFEIKGLDAEEAKLTHGPENDRARLAIGIRRKCLNDLQQLPDRAMRRVVAAMTELHEYERTKGLTNHGK